MKALAHTAFLALLVSLLATSAALAADGGESEPFDRVIEHYEAARLVLADDSTDGVADHGAAIEKVLAELSEEGAASAAGLGKGSEEAQKMLAELQEAAASLAGASSLEAARDAFYDLSKPLVRWRKALAESSTAGDLPVVAYCSMAKRSWLQPKGELANPYHGTSMLRCGQVVDG